MADFLTRLAMRIGEPEGFVRPRLPSLFEPSHLDPVLPAGVETAVSDARADAADIGFGDAPDQSTPVETPDALDARAADVPPKPGPPRDRTRPRSARPPEAGVEAEAPPQEEATARASQHDGRPTRPALPREPRAETVETVPPAARRTVVVPPAVDVSVASPLRAISSRRESVADPIAPQRQNPEAEHRRALPTAPQQPSPAQQPDMLRPRVAIHDRPPPFSIKHAPAAEPTIHVTIGRVEVRAVTPAAPSGRKARDASPVMSLDEYLRTRAR